MMALVAMEWAKKNHELLEFIKEKSKDVEPASIKTICRDFAKATGDTRTMSALEKLIYRNGSKIQDMDFQMDDKVRMLFTLCVPIKDYYLKELLMYATVHLDRKNRIQYYEAHDGHMLLRRLPHLLKDRDSCVQFMDFPKSPEDYDPQGDYLDMDTKHFAGSFSPNMVLENSLKRKLNPDETAGPSKIPHTIDRIGDEPTMGLKTPKFEISEDVVASNSPSTSSMVKFEHSVELASVTQFLKQLQSIVGTLDSLHLSETYATIENMIKEPRLQGLDVSNQTVRRALESALYYVVSNATRDQPTEESIFFKEFILVFRAATFHLVDFSEALHEVQSDYGFLEKRISFEKIKVALQFALGFVPQ